MTAGEFADLPIAKVEPCPGECARCGDCCRMFHLAYSMRRLPKVAPECDDPVIRGMLIPLGQAREADGRFGRGFWYTCRHFREDLGDGLPGCAIRATRPEMCRGFPYDKPNDLPHCRRCTWHPDRRPGS